MNRSKYYRQPVCASVSFSESVTTDGLVCFVQDLPIGIDVRTEDVETKIKCGIPLSDASVSVPDEDAIENIVESLNTQSNE